MHLLVAAYLDYKAPPDDTPQTERDTGASDPDAPIVPAHTPWMAGMGAIPASDDLRNAATPMQGLAAVERLFFGTLMEI